MPGQKPSKGIKGITIDEFQGVNDAYADEILLKGMCRFSLGVKDTSEQQLERIGGNIPLLTCSSSHGAIMDIQQLDFASSSYVLIHSPHESMVGIREMVDSFDANPFPEVSDGITEYGI